MPEILIRSGNKADIPQILALIKELALYEKAPQEVSNTEEQMLIDGFGDRPLYGFFVAESDRQIVGFALYYYRYSTWKGKVLYLEDLYIQDAYRRYKIGYRLFEKLIELAKNENCKRISWQVLEWNEPAIQFYKKIGAELDPEWVNGFLTSDKFDDFIKENYQIG